MSLQHETSPGMVPNASTPEGARVRQDFIAAMLEIVGDSRLFWLPKTTDTTTSVSVDKLADVLTHNATIAARITSLGSGAQVDFDGDDDEADTPDSDDHSFGDGVVDEPFSLLWVGTPDTDVSAQTLISKLNDATTEEYELHLTATNGFPTLDIWDASASAAIGRSHDVDIGTSLVFIAATYNGNGSVSGINLYKNAALVDDGVGGTTGTYVAMENTASLVRLGTRFTTNERFYNGKMALAIITAKALSHNEIWSAKTLINSFLNASL